MTVAVGPARPPHVAERGPAHVTVGGPAIGGLARSPRRYLNTPGSAGASNRRPHPQAAHSRVTTAAAGRAHPPSGEAGSAAGQCPWGRSPGRVVACGRVWIFEGEPG